MIEGGVCILKYFGLKYRHVSFLWIKKKIIYDGSFISKMFCITPFPNVLVNLDFCIDVSVDWNHGEHQIPTFHVRKELRLGRHAEGQGQAVIVIQLP